MFTPTELYSFIQIQYDTHTPNKFLSTIPYEKEVY